MQVRGDAANTFSDVVLRDVFVDVIHAAPKSYQLLQSVVMSHHHVAKKIV